jgi:hypothetical protein
MQFDRHRGRQHFEDCDCLRAAEIRAQQEANADSLAAEVLMSLLGSSDSFATSDDHVTDGGRPAVNSRPTTPLQPAELQQLDEKPSAPATQLTIAPAATVPNWLPVRRR